jgi:hypothetical protein
MTQEKMGKRRTDRVGRTLETRQGLVSFIEDTAGI